MSKSHQKKRNCGLLYEFLIKEISQSLIDGNQKRSSLALKILKRHFKAGTELHREFRLVHSLMKTTVSNATVAASILNEAKNAARSHNVKNLDREKSLLIRQINHQLNDDSFFDRHVSEYRMYATIQTLLNEWRRGNSADIGTIAKFEDQLTQWLLINKDSDVTQLLNTESDGTNRLLMTIMMKKLNEKYSGVLNDEQKKLLRSYAFASIHDDKSIVQKDLESTRNKLIEAITLFRETNKSNEFLDKKLSAAQETLLAEKLDVVDDDTVTRFMLYTKLYAELGSEE
jgi:hypothetical protein